MVVVPDRLRGAGRDVHRDARPRRIDDGCHYRWDLRSARGNRSSGGSSIQVGWRRPVTAEATMTRDIAELAMRGDGGQRVAFPRSDRASCSYDVLHQANGKRR